VLINSPNAEVMTMADAPPPGLQHTRTGWSHGRFLSMWAAVWSVLLVPLFLGVTVLTVTLWATSPEYTETTPVSDLSFLALGAMIAMGFVSQLRRRAFALAGAEQSVLAALSLAVAGALGGRVEPALGGLVLLLAALVRPAFDRSWRGTPRVWGRPDLPSALLVVVAVPPLVAYSARLIVLAHDAGPSCFLGKCAHGDRFAEMAATSGAIIMLGGLSALRRSGWRLPAWSAGLAAAVMGVSSLALPESPGALGTAWAVLASVWAVSFLVLVQRRPRAGRAASSTS
jgi:hypothetical protein